MLYHFYTEQSYNTYSRQRHSRKVAVSKKQKKTKQNSIRVEHRQKWTGDNLFPGHPIYYLQVLHIISLIFPLLVRDKF